VRRALLALVVSATACQTTPDGQGPAGPRDLPEAEPVGRYYTVAAGDTLYDIAERFDLPAEEIAEVNGIDKPDELAVGQLLFLPEDDPMGLPPEPAPPPKPKGPLPPHDGSLAWPLDGGVLLREFDASPPIPYEGIEIAAPQGTEVKAAAVGEVLYAADEGTPYGTMIILKHSDTLSTIYAHLDGLSVEPGDRVKAGQLIGRVGSSGRVPSPRLHFQVRENRAPVDPLSKLPEP
jgi:murein DD-endopeptidase MepM/ murein hydrolase activator NlpD